MWSYLKSKEFWFTILGIVVLGFVTFIALFYIVFPIYTKHGETVMVPEIHKLGIKEAEERLSMAGLEMVVVDSIYQISLPPGSVVSNDPPSFSMVKPGRKIYVSANRVIPPEIQFPKNVLEVSDYQAKLTLENWGFSIKNIIYEPNEFSDLVLAVKFNGKELAVGDLLPLGSEVDLIVAGGLGNKRVALPKLVGLASGSAITRIHELSLNIGGIRYKPESDEAEGLVIQQSPDYKEGDSIKIGSSMVIFVAGNRPTEDEIE